MALTPPIWNKVLVKISSQPIDPILKEILKTVSIEEQLHSPYGYDYRAVYSIKSI